MKRLLIILIVGLILLNPNFTNAEECIPNCIDKECGYDGCGGVCGSCPPDYGCLDFVCTPSWCVDTDGGKNPAVKGTLTYLEKGSFWTDQCLTPFKVQEGYCDEPYVLGFRTQTMDCQYGCEDGACKTTSTGKPDLIITDVSFSSENPKSGDMIYVTVTIKNIGTLPVKNFEYKVLQEDGTHVGGVRKLTNLIPNDDFTSKSGSTNFHGGKNKLTIKVDPNNEINELNEGNNILVKTIDVVESEYEEEFSRKFQKLSNTNNINVVAIYNNIVAWIDIEGYVFTYDLKTDREKKITTTKNARSSLSIYNNKIIWMESVTEGKRSGHKWNVHLYSILTGKDEVIAESDGMATPHIFKNKIVWTKPHSKIMLYDIDSKTSKEITSGNNAKIYKNILVINKLEQGKRSYYLYDLNLDKEVKITPKEAKPLSYYVYGSKIIWEDEREGYKNMYMYDINTNTEIQLTYDKLHKFGPFIRGNTALWYSQLPTSILEGIIVYDIPSGRKQIIEKPKELIFRWSYQTYNNKLAFIACAVHGECNVYITDLIGISSFTDETISPKIFKEDIYEPEEILIEESIECPSSTCLGEGDICLPIGFRTEFEYCDSRGEFKEQKLENIYCNNNFECKSNLCIDNECIKQGFFRRIIGWFKKIF